MLSPPLHSVAYVRIRPSCYSLPLARVVDADGCATREPGRPPKFMMLAALHSMVTPERAVPVVALGSTVDVHRTRNDLHLTRAPLRKSGAKFSNDLTKPPDHVPPRLPSLAVHVPWRHCPAYPIFVMAFLVSCPKARLRDSRSNPSRMGTGDTQDHTASSIGNEAVMAGLDPAIHGLGRGKQRRPSCNDVEFCFCRSRGT